MSNKKEYSLCGVDLTFLKALNEELTKALDDAESIAENFGDTPFYTLHSEEKTKFIVAVAKAKGFATGLSEEAAIVVKMLSQASMNGPISKSKVKTVNDLIDQIKTAASGGTDGSGGLGGLGGGGLGGGGLGGGGSLN